jgi:hypothetical protein
MSYMSRSAFKPLSWRPRRRSGLDPPSTKCCSVVSSESPNHSTATMSLIKRIFIRCRTYVTQRGSVNPFLHRCSSPEPSVVVSSQWRAPKLASGKKSAIKRPSVKGKSSLWQGKYCLLAEGTAVLRPASISACSSPLAVFLSGSVGSFPHRTSHPSGSSRRRGQVSS